MIRRRTASTLVLAAPMLGLLLVPAAAEAQDQPGPLDPLGIRLGGFLVYPRLQVAETYNSNIFAEPDNEEDDLITVISPTVSVQSNFPRHALNLNAGANIGIHLDQDDENYEDYFVGLNGQLDVIRSAAFFGSLRYANEHEARESPDAPDVTVAEEPTELDVFAGELGYRQAFNRLNFRLRGGARFTDYEDVQAVGGGTIEQDDRDRFTYDAALRVGYLVSPRINVFTEGRYTITDFQDDPADDDLNRDAEGYEVRGGVEVDFTALLTGEAFGGYRVVTYDGDFDDDEGFSFGAGLTWFPTRLTTVRLVGERDVEPTTVPNAAGNFSTDIRLEVDHELLRNVLLSGLLGYTRDEFDSADRTDNTYAAGAGAEYLVNRYLSVGLNYRYTTRESDVADEEFDRHLVALALTGHL